MWASDVEVTDVILGEGYEECEDLTGKRKADGTRRQSPTTPHKEVFNKSEGADFRPGVVSFQMV